MTGQYRLVNTYFHWLIFAKTDINSGCTDVNRLPVRGQDQSGLVMSQSKFLFNNVIVFYADTT